VASGATLSYGSENAKGCAYLRLRQRNTGLDKFQNILMFLGKCSDLESEPHKPTTVGTSFTTVELFFFKFTARNTFLGIKNK
jgi:hypothetical protein